MGVNVVSIHMGADDILITWQHLRCQLLRHLLRLLWLDLAQRKGSHQLVRDQPALLAGHRAHSGEVPHRRFCLAGGGTDQDLLIGLVWSGDVFDQIVQVHIRCHRQDLQVSHLYSPLARG